MANYNRYKRHRYLFMTQDPVHVGTGGYRLGRVDNSIVREPGSHVPKVPGTSLSGAARSYAAMQFGKRDCAGQKKHCGRATCPICYTFGYVRGQEDDQEAHSGTVNLFDAGLVLFPVHSMAGPVWATTWGRLAEAGFSLPADPPPPAPDGALFTWARTDPLNLGWLMLSGQETAGPEAPPAWQGQHWDAVKARLVVLNEALFGQVVNSNLEVRTSVSIDPKTGAAESGALFTYEAIPRAAFLAADVVQDDYRYDPDKVGEVTPPWTIETGQQGQPLRPAWGEPLDVVRGGLNLAAWLGVGGMGTRGFGRITVVGEPQAEEWAQEGNHDDR